MPGDDDSDVDVDVDVLTDVEILTDSPTENFQIGELAK
jgi:hypothetical protein